MRRLLIWLLPLLLPASPCAAQRPEASLKAGLEQLSGAGSGEAAYHLAMLYHLGLAGVAKDPRKAFDFFKLAAARGDPLGAYKLGCLYSGQGEGVVAADPVLALRYKLVAAEAGYALAQEEVAAHYFSNGDWTKGLHWLEAAGRQGSFNALIGLYALHSGGVPEAKVAKDPVRQYAYLMLAFADGDEKTAAGNSAIEKEAASKLTREQLAAARAMILAWRAAPTPLTLKAREGLEAAGKLRERRP
jgi:TPR repeat protein